MVLSAENWVGLTKLSGSRILKTDEIVQDFLDEWKFVVVKETDELYYYDFENGIYVCKAETKIRETICTLVLARWSYIVKVNELSTVILNIKGNSKTILFNDFNNVPYLLPLKNGVYNLKEKTFSRTFDSNLLFTFRLPYEYDPTKVEVGFFVKFLKDILIPKTGPSEGKEKDVLVIQELMGYLLMPCYKFRKAFMFYGSGGNGKSSLICVLRGLVGNDNVSAVSLQDLEDRAFSRISLVGKLANMVADISSRDMQSTGMFKQLTGGEDLIYADVKFKESVGFVNRAKMIFSCNNTPKIPPEDDNDAFWDRWVFVAFPNRFENTDEEIPNFGSLLSVPENLSALFNWALVGLDRLESQGGFTESPSTLDVRKLFRMAQNSFAYFFEEYCEVDFRAEVLKNYVYDSYHAFCAQRNLKPIRSSDIGRYISSNFKSVYDVRGEEIVDEFGHRYAPYSWRGFRIKGDVDFMVPKQEVKQTVDGNPISCDVIKVGDSVEQNSA